VIVADTSALIDAWEPARPDSSADERERKAAARLAVERLMSTRVLVASAITVAELLRRPNLADGRRRHLETLVDLLRGVLPVTHIAAELGAHRARWRARRGFPVPELADSLIIGTCLELDAPLLTTNARHFTGTPGLSVLTVDDARH
jgi:predicted nucleic acid-binding protein